MPTYRFHDPDGHEFELYFETGPHKHAIQQTFFLYVYEPGGNRIELCNPCARLIFAPDWAPISWTQAERAKGQAWGPGYNRLVPHARNATGAVSGTEPSQRTEPRGRWPRTGVWHCVDYQR